MRSMEDLVDRFERLPDWRERYKYLISLGEKLPPFDESDRTAENKVTGCMSQVWMVLHPDHEDTLDLRADSDAAIVRGLIAVLLRLYHGTTPEEAVQIDVDGAFARLGLDKHLSPNRRNGFYSMVLRVKELAVGLRVAAMRRDKE
jgi:cysteine desulfuration protein SufE